MRVLVVEDDESIATILRLFCEREGHHFTWAASGETALRVLRRERVDLVLLDVVLPGIDGTDVFREMARHPVLRHIPVIFQTALATQADRHSLLTLRPKGLLIKPFGRRALIDALEAGPAASSGDRAGHG